MTAVNRHTGQAGGFQSLSGAGTYTVSSLAPGSYTVVATDCDGSSNLAQKVYQRPVTVRAGRTTRKVALRLAHGGAVTGRITTASNGQAVPDACVEAIPVSVAAAKLGIGSFAITGRSGRYKMVGLRAGRYRIEIFPSCFGTAVDLHPVTLRHSVQVAQGQVKAGVNAGLRAGGSIMRPGHYHGCGGRPRCLRRGIPDPRWPRRRNIDRCPWAVWLHWPDAGQVQSRVRGPDLLRRRGGPRDSVVRRRSRQWLCHGH